MIFIQKEKIKQPYEFDHSILDEIKSKLNFSDEVFTNIMNLPKKSYRDFATYKKLFERLKPLFFIMYKMDMVPKSFYLKFTRTYND